MLHQQIKNENVFYRLKNIFRSAGDTGSISVCYLFKVHHLKSLRARKLRNGKTLLSVVQLSTNKQYFAVGDDFKKALKNLSSQLIK